jgi:hypothetical protein
MLFDKTRVIDKLDAEPSSTSPPTPEAKDGSAPSALPAFQSREQEKPLTCMIYFFASQMSRNVQPTPQAPSTFPPQAPPPPTHRLDTLLTTLRTHALLHPNLVTRFDLLPVEIPWPNMKKKPQLPKESMHDTLLLVKFRSAQAREAFIATRGWSEFMEKTEKEGVFRRVPHVRCARTIKGLRDPIEVLSV